MNPHLKAAFEAAGNDNGAEVFFREIAQIPKDIDLATFRHEGNRLVDFAFDPDILRFLIVDCKSDVKQVVTPEFGWTPLFLLVMASSIRGSRVVIEEGGVDINHQDSKGDSVLHIAVRREPGRAYALCQMLLERGARTDLANKAGSTPYDEARMAGGALEALFAARVARERLDQAMISQVPRTSGCA